ncbi:MAG: ATP-binding protein [Planctomycetales bacterium]
MTQEGQSLDRKSLRYAIGKHDDLHGLACDCVGFANAAGGEILLGIEDGDDEPPLHQRVSDDLVEKLRKRIPQVTVNVAAVPQKRTAANGGEYVEIQVAGNQQSIAATSDGRYFLRVADETRRLLPDDLGRLMADRNSLVWELSVVRRAPIEKCDPQKRASFVSQVRASDRVSPFVKGKSDDELLEYYLFQQEGCLTNLGVLWIGRREDRAALLYAPVIQCIKYDENDRKVRKQMWDDYSLNPLELIQAVWDEVPDWRESYEFPAGLFRKTVPHYEEVVVRELLANALVHRPYAQRGDIFVNLYPDRLEVHNPGLLPIGVTPRNILHASVQRNPHLAKVFYDLKLMEREGSGFDRMYEVLLASGRPMPQVAELDDRVVVTVRKQIVKSEIIDFMSKADGTLQPTQKELISLGLIAQHDSLTATELVTMLDLRDTSELRHWIGRLKPWGLIGSRGRTKATEYFVKPEILRRLQFKGPTTLKGIEKHRLRELIFRDLSIYERSSRTEIHSRIGTEIPEAKLRRTLAELVTEGELETEGERKARRYLLRKKGPNNG